MQAYINNKMLWFFVFVACFLVLFQTSEAKSDGPMKLYVP